MKNVFLFFTLATLIFSCSDDRVSPYEYKSLNGFYERNREETQTIVIESDSGTSPIIGKKGTEIYGSRQLFEHLNGDSVKLPWAVNLIELYTIKDYLLYQQPTTAITTPLTSAGTVKIMCYSEQKELKLRTGALYYVKLSTPNPVEGYKDYQGGTSPDTFIDWLLATDGSSVSLVTDKYQLNLAKLGWNQCANPSFGATTTVSFITEGTGGENIDLWLIPTDKHALFYGNNLTAANIPVGEKVTVFALALNQNDDLVMHKEEITITENMVIPLVLHKTDEKDVLSFINNL